MPLLWLPVCLLPLLLCVGCAPKAGPGPGAEMAVVASAELLAAQRQRAGNLRSWKARGNISVRADRRAWRGRFHWEQAGRRFKMRLSNVLGATLMMISGKFGGAVHAITANGERRRADTPEQLVRELLGVDVPVTNLRFWIAGAPAYGAPARDARARGGKLQSFDQSGWRVRYAAWHESDELPGRMVLSRAPGDTAVIAISIQSWEDLIWITRQ